MFVLDSTLGSADGSTLRLDGVDSMVTVFTDRPMRAASRITLRDFVDSWEMFGFDTDPPNAAIAFDGDRDVVVTLRAPQLVEEMRSTALEFGYSVLAGQPDLPATFTQPTLFVDSVGSASTLWTSTGTNGVSVEATMSVFGIWGVTLAAMVIPPQQPAALVNSYLTAYLFDGQILDPSDSTLTEAEARSAVAEAIANGPVSTVSSSIPYPEGGRSMALQAPIDGGGDYTLVVVAAPVAGVSRVDASTDALAVIEFSA